MEQLALADFVRQSRKLGNERETHSRVLDNLTIRTLNKLINTDSALSTIGGCISSGKEANVYYCMAPKNVLDCEPSDDGVLGDTTELEELPSEPKATVDGKDTNEARTQAGIDKMSHTSGSRDDYVPVAVKVYATTVNIFKERQQYMQGWRNSTGVRSDRKMVSQWTTNEYKHLKRLQMAGVPSPRPIRHRENVLVMSLVMDKEGKPCPRLKEAIIEGEDSAERWEQLYMQLLGYMRRMYKMSRLVHGDLSEYNILYQDGKLCIIDVSQSLEHNHPQCFNMLRRDISNINSFFKKTQVELLGQEAIFQFITTDKAPLDEEGMHDAIRKLLEEQVVPATEEDRARVEVDEAAFKDKFIPRTLQELYELQIEGAPVDMSAVKHLLADAKPGGEQEEATTSNSESEREESDGESDQDVRSDGEAQKRPRGKRFMPKTEKTMQKTQMKEQKREKRQNKMPKKVKAALVAKTARKKR